MSYLLVHIQLPEDLSGVQKMCVIHDSSDHVSKALKSQQLPAPTASPKDRKSIYMENREDVLLDVECEEWQIEQKRNPVPVDKEQEGQEAMDCSFRNDVCVETVAEIDRINVVTVPFPSQYACTENSS
jgi:hypothetical protein